MLYCPKCQVLVKEGDRCPACNSKKLRDPQEGDPVMLLTATEKKCRRIAGALDGQEIPHEERVCGVEGIASAYAGCVVHFPLAENEMRMMVRMGSMRNSTAAKEATMAAALAALLLTSLR